MIVFAVVIMTIAASCFPDHPNAALDMQSHHAITENTNEGIAAVEALKPNEREVYLIGVSVLLALLFTILFWLYIGNNKTRKLYQKQRQQYKEQTVTISTIYKSLPDLVFCKDVNYKYTSCNPGFEKFTGYSEAELIGKTNHEISGLPEKISADIMAADQKVIHEKTTVKTKAWLPYPDGLRRCFETVKAPVIQDGKVTGLIGIMRDITELHDAVEASRRNLERIQVMLDTMPLCCFLVNKRYQIFDCNEEAVRLFRFKDKQDLLTQVSDPSFLSPEYQPDGQLSSEFVATSIDIAMKDGRYASEYLHQLLDGTPIPVIVTLVRVNYDNDYAILVYIRDMREHKRMMGEIEQQNNLLKAVNGMSAALLDPDIDKFEDSLLLSMSVMAKAVDVDRVCIWENHVRDEQLFCTLAYEWLGIDNVNQMTGNDMVMDVPYETIPGWEEILSQGNFINRIVRNTPPKERAQLGFWGSLSIFVAPVFVHNTFWGYVGFDDCHRERLFTENEGLILCSASRMIASALIRNDITQSLRETAKRLEEAAEKANEANMLKNISIRSMESILNSIDALIHTTVPGTGEFLFVNKYMKKILGRENDDLVGEYCYKLFHNADKMCSFCPSFQLDNEPGQVIVWDEYMESLGIHVRHSDCYIDWPSGEKVHLQHAIDITELISAREEAEQSSRSKSAFLAKMSHEIRTPMNAIMGMAELALRENDPGAIREHILTVKQASANLLSIINDILDFSKIESGRLQITPVNYLFSSLLNDVISIIRMRVIDSRIRFSVIVDCNIPNALFGDEIRIRQILTNILGNAVKYTESGFVSLIVSKETMDESTINLIMGVADSGKGIKEEDIGNLFGEYVQVDVNENRGIEGVGLGLAITHSIVKAMGGDISVYSEWGKGSTFAVRLPQKIHSPEKLAVVENPEHKEVLVYERRKVYADSISFAIDNLGVYCVVVSSNSEFCEKISNHAFSFIFLSFALYKQNINIIREFGVNAKIVILAEFGEVIPDKNLSVLAMPAHSILIANILNGVSGSFSYAESHESIARFTAPEAKILIVDDINTNLKVAKGLLLPYQMHVDLCTTGAEAILATKSARYDLVFMDHRMPGMDGVEATKLIRAMGNDDSYYKDLPIVALTANAISGIREMFLQNGFNDFLSKPIDTVNLNTILGKWLPKEKQKSSVMEKDTVAISNEGEGEITIEIDGVDVKKGISISGGTIAFYLETLAVFYEDGLERMKLVKECIETGNVALYTTYVHALKSALFNIGASMLSESAKALELAGERKDMTFIEKNNTEFLTALETLLGKINDCLQVQTEIIKEGGDESVNAEMFKSELGRLKTAIDVMDGGAMTEAVNNLQKLAYTEKFAAVIRSILNNILLAEYDEVEALIDSLIREDK